jgi:hypothetical protein
MFLISVFITDKELAEGKMKLDRDKKMAVRTTVLSVFVVPYFSLF